MPIRPYSIKESVNRIYRLFIGDDPPTDIPDSLTGRVYSEDEALSRMAEVIADSLPGESARLPSAISVPASSVKDGDTVWDDLRVPALSVRVPATGGPDFEQFHSNATGTSTGVFLYWFDPGSVEQIYFVAQMPHSWKGTPIHPHVHWSPAADTTGTVSWGLEYTWAGINEDFPGTQIIYGNSVIGDDQSPNQYHHYLTSLPVVTGSVSGVSSMIVCRLFRDATGVGLGDSSPHDAGFLEMDFHYEIDTIGSDEIYTK